jgi:hypothetical protein
VETLSQKAGVPTTLLRRLVLKELVDNALDAGGAHVRIGAIDEHGHPFAGRSADCNRFFIQDDGPGIPVESVARLFSINRPLLSSKLWRLPARGALGNGLRVVAGAVAASDGALEVWTRNRHLVLYPQEDGSTSAEAFDADFPTGTRIEVVFGERLPHDPAPLQWAEAAIHMAGGSTSYSGKPSPWWYDGDHFFELLRAAGERPVRDLIASLDGCTGAKAGRIAAAFKNVPCNQLSRHEATGLLKTARAEARPVKPERLGSVGPIHTLPPSHALERGTISLGGREPKATIPFVVESWVYFDAGNKSRPSLSVNVNRTPITGRVEAYRDKGKLYLNGCGLNFYEINAPKGWLNITLNVTTPFCPITSDGKEPDLKHFAGHVAGVIGRAASRARRLAPRAAAAGEATTHKAVMLEHLEEGIAKASGNGVYRFNQRQLFYVLRPRVIEAFGAEPSYQNFEKIITDYEEEHGNIPNMYRDPRGTLYHPHKGEDISLGTLAVEKYERPGWTFNKVLYIEKEGFFEALKAARWPERHDCALLTSKGFATRAVRDLVDLLADGEEPVRVFCIHDADAAGTMIYQTLQEETKARARRRIDVVNLGLEPWEAFEMGLEPETIKERDRRVAVAEYVFDEGDDEEWVEWLQNNRVELNAMTTPALLAWLDGKMEEQEGDKVIPPAPVVAKTAADKVAEHLRRVITERVLREARLDEQIADAARALTVPEGEALVGSIGEWLAGNPDQHWSDYVDAVAKSLAETGEGPRQSPED